MLPQAEISTAGVIMAVNTAMAEAESMVTISVAVSFIETNWAEGNRRAIGVLFSRFRLGRINLLRISGEE